jgi:signal transduction histidine kinase
VTGDEDAPSTSGRADPLDGRAFSNLAHELRNPLAVILGYAELLRVRDDESTRIEAANRISEAAQHLGYVADDLLTVFAIESGMLEIEPAPVDLESIVKDALAGFAATEHDYVFSSEAENGRWPRIEADSQHVSRILTNLVLNACRRSPDAREVAVSVRTDDGFAAVTVSDNGVALTNEQIARAFDRLAPIEVPGHPEIRSSGLELYKVRRLVELQGGAVTAESGPGRRGSRFTFTLPLADDLSDRR